MKTVAELPPPRLVRGRFPFPAADAESQGQAGEDAVPSSAGACPSGDGVFLVTDEALLRATGVRVAFAERSGGASAGGFSSLNLGAHVDDDARAVEENRRRLLSALGASRAELVVPNQVHGTDLVTVRDAGASQVQAARARAAEGADGIVVTCADVAALLCFADCMPVVLVAPGGSFAVVHAGWRGVYGHIVPKALRNLCGVSGADAAQCNVYLGPYIHAECFEVSADLAEKFALEFGPACVPSKRHVDLGAAMRADLRAVGVDARRIADVGACTVCENDRFFSYRAQHGACGRHGAVAVRFESEV